MPGGGSGLGAGFGPRRGTSPDTPGRGVTRLFRAGWVGLTHRAAPVPDDIDNAPAAGLDEYRIAVRTVGGGCCAVDRKCLPQLSLCFLVLAAAAEHRCESRAVVRRGPDLIARNGGVHDQGLACEIFRLLELSLRCADARQRLQYFSDSPIVTTEDPLRAVKRFDQQWLGLDEATLIDTDIRERSRQGDAIRMQWRYCGGDDRGRFAPRRFRLVPFVHEAPRDLQ